MAWLFTATLGLKLNLATCHPTLIAICIIIRTFLHTGLFIIAHDAMHNSLLPGQLEPNRWIGRCMLMIYAGLDFKLCQQNHNLHHQFPESEKDPDFSHGHQVGIIAWYVNFIGNYVHPSQLLRLAVSWAIIYGVASTFFTTPIHNVLAFYVAPLVLSSLQLFIVGTWLPHRHCMKATSSTTPRSLSLNPIVSFAACYHFGYHREHHESPSIPWFELPRLNLAKKAVSA